MRNLSELKGQSRAHTLLEEYLTKTPPHLLLFVGPDGVGKYSAAEAFVQMRFCLTGNACGNCTPCRKVEKGEHPDYIRFPNDKVKIGDRKNPEAFTSRWLLQTRLIYSPYESPFRFVLFPDAEKIQDEAETALLKTLEEPSPGTHFIILARDLSHLKETILSRGVLIPFQALRMDVLREVASSTGLKVEEEDLELLGGTMQLLPIIQTPLYSELRTRIRAMQTRIDLIDLEKWILDQEKALKSELPSDEIWELVTLIWIQNIAKQSESSLFRDESHRRNALLALLDFKQHLHEAMPGFTPYIVGQLMSRMISYADAA